MEVPAAASRYARTLYEYAVEENARDAVRSDLLKLRQLIAESPEFAAFVGNPTIPPDVANTVVSSLFEDQADAVTMRFLGFLASRGRLTLLEAICERYEQRVCDALGILKVGITSAHALSDAQLKAMKQKLADRHGKTIDTELKVDASLIGGFKIQIGDRIRDFSMVNRLDQFEHSVINAKHEHDRLKV